jgi:hypothetical protein
VSLTHQGLSLSRHFAQTIAYAKHRTSRAEALCDQKLCGTTEQLPEKL